MFSLRRLSTKLLSMGSNLWANSELTRARARARKRRTPQCVKYHFHKYNDKFTDPQRNYAQNFASSCFYNHFQWLISFLFFHRRPHYFYACMNLGTATIFFSAFHFVFSCVAFFPHSHSLLCLSKSDMPRLSVTFAWRLLLILPHTNGCRRPPISLLQRNVSLV